MLPSIPLTVRDIHAFSQHSPFQNAFLSILFVYSLKKKYLYTSFAWQLNFIYKSSQVNSQVHRVTNQLLLPPVLHIAGNVFHEPTLALLLPLF